MISTSTFVPTTFCGTPARPAEQPVLTQEPTPCPPQDGVNFTQIDNAATAAQLPIFDPAVIGNVIAGAVICAMGGGSMAAHVNATILTGSKPDQGAGADVGQAHVTYLIDPSTPEHMVSEGGYIGGMFAAGNLTIVEDAKTARFAGSHEDLTFSVDEENQKLHIDGTLGQVETHLTVGELAGTRSDESAGVHTEGTIGGEAYTADILLQATEQNEDEMKGKMTVHGQLGSSEVCKEYDITVVNKNDTLTIDTVGGGNNGGVQQNVTVHTDLYQRG